MHRSATHLYKRLFSYIKPYSMIFAVGILANMSYSALDASFSYMLKPLMDQGFIARDLNFIKWVPLFALAALSLRGVLSFVSSYCMTWVARSVVMRLRQSLFAHFLKLPARYYDNITSGQMLSKLLYDVEQVAQVSADALTTFIQSVFLVLGLFVVMFTISWGLSLIYMSIVPFIAMIVKYSNRRIRKSSHAVQKAMGQVTDIAEESIEGYRVVRTFGGEPYEQDKFVNATQASRRSDMKVALTKGYTSVAVLFIAACGISTIIYLAISPTSSFVLSAGSFASIMTATLMLLKPLKNLTTVISIIQRGLAGAESVFTLLDLPAEKDFGNVLSQRSRGAIRIEQLDFRYHTKGDLILQDINLQIQPGETVAIVGPSGSGKSTLISLLPRFYEITTGRIYLDDIDVSDIKLSDLRKQFALVTQNLTLFNDTIANNIAYGCRDSVSFEEITQAAESAHAMEFISLLPEGLNTLVGENGVLLSGGQRQRIAIARAILKNAPILILDEATSALDTESERSIQSALEAVMRNRTTLVIAHRLSTIEHADKIIFLKAGRIVEVGSHQDLLSTDSHYAKLHAMQFTVQNDMQVNSTNV